MAGVYLHIPFCSKKCAYCDFYSIANIGLIDNFVRALCDEIELRKNYLGKDKIQTIYFGGGTPSLLSKKQFALIFEKLFNNFKFEDNLEITIEANPENLTKEFLKELLEIGFNRLSIGIQSFNDEHLKLMKRQHSEMQSVKVVRDAQEIGFSNISVDLIYGLPNLTNTVWESNIEKIVDLNIQHISAYHLTIEPNTLFHKYYKSKKLNLPTEEQSLSQFKILKEKTAEKGFLHYEISNFALDGSISLHNSNYWMGVKYLGLGPSAHSYNLTSREWNIQNLNVYTEGILKGKPVKELEILSNKEKFNDFVITSLRTMWGINIEKLKTEHEKKFIDHFQKISKKYINNNLMQVTDKSYILNEEAIFISDNIIQDFMYD